MRLRPPDALPTHRTDSSPAFLARCTRGCLRPFWCPTLRRRTEGRADAEARICSACENVVHHFDISVQTCMGALSALLKCESNRGKAHSRKGLEWFGARAVAVISRICDWSFAVSDRRCVYVANDRGEVIAEVGCCSQVLVCRLLDGCDGDPVSALTVPSYPAPPSSISAGAHRARRRGCLGA